MADRNAWRNHARASEDHWRHQCYCWKLDAYYTTYPICDLVQYLTLYLTSSLRRPYELFGIASQNLRIIVTTSDYIYYAETFAMIIRTLLNRHQHLYHSTEISVS